MRIYYAVTPEDWREASQAARQFAHVAYRLGEGSVLLRRNLPMSARSGLLSLSDRESPAIREPEALCAAVERECVRRGFCGVVLDFEGPFREDLASLAGELEKRLAASGRQLYLPEAYADAAPGGAVLLCTAVSGGNFREYVQETAKHRGGAGRLALDVERLRMDFRLPAPSGMGKPLDAEVFASLREGRAVYFSRDLCARYFTCTQNGEPHFVLFDDADTLRRKLRLGAELGVRAAFFQWPEVRDIAAGLPVK